MSDGEPHDLPSQSTGCAACAQHAEDAFKKNLLQFHKYKATNTTLYFECAEFEILPMFI